MTAPQPVVSQTAHADDVKVAGAAGAARAAAPAGDTLGFDAFPPGPAGHAAGPRDEIASGAPRPGARRAASGKRTGMRIVAVAAGAAVVIGGGAAAAFALTGGSDDDGATVQPTRELADPAPKVDPRVLQEQRRQLAMERASRETRQYSGKGLDLRPKGEPIPTKTPEKKKDDEGGGGSGGGAPVADPVPAGEAQQIAKKMMPSFGFTGDGEFGCLVKLWNKESGWRTNAANPTSQAYGIPQANPGSKMASAGADWRTSASTQIKWGLGYIKDRYGTPCKAWSHSQSVGWY
nr:lytic transglycosylase domain-containing protein [Actinomadura sp. GC306]